MRIVNVRMQHACNSSSTHTLLIGRSERTRKYEPGSFGWSHFVLGDRAARQVALGACFFMLSDSLLATNRFVQPMPLAQVWVLATYYAAQAFIVHGMVVGLRRPQNTSV